MTDARTTAARVARPLALLAVLLAPAPGASQGQPGGSDAVERAPVDLEVSIGFADAFRLGRWAPVTVLAANRGRDLRAVLEVETSGGDQFQGSAFSTVQRRPLDLPGESRKRARFTVLLESFGAPLVVRLRAGGRTVAERSIDLRRRFVEQALVVALSRDANLDYLNGLGEGAPRVTYPHPELLPDRWQGYDGVSAVVVHGVSLEGLTARQHDALVRWIAAGGRLVVGAAADQGLLRTPRLAELLPGRPGARRHHPDGTVLGARLGTEVVAPRGFDLHHLQALQARGGRVVHGTDALPLVVARDLGEGEVVFLGFDIARAPFDVWPGMPALWTGLLQLEPARGTQPVLEDLAEENLVVSHLRTHGREFVSLATVLVWVAFYLGVLATAYRWRASDRDPDRRGPPGRGRGAAGPLARAGLAWGGPVVLAAAAYGLFGPVLFPAGQSTVAYSWLRPLGDGRHARLEVDLGLYSNRAGPLAVLHEGAEPALRPVFGTRAGGRNSSWVLEEGPVRRAAPRRREPYALHVLEGYDVVEYRWDADLSAGPGGQRLRVRTRARQESDGAWIALDGKVLALGPLAAGEAREWLLDESFPALPLAGRSWAEAIADAVLAGPAGQASAASRGAAPAADSRRTAIARRLAGLAGAAGETGAVPALPAGRAVIVARVRPLWQVHPAEPFAAGYRLALLAAPLERPVADTPPDTPHGGPRR